eukprot:1602765-Prymnesium_polylepis.1
MALCVWQRSQLEFIATTLWPNSQVKLDLAGGNFDHTSAASFVCFSTACHTRPTFATRRTVRLHGCFDFRSRSRDSDGPHTRP